jgi:hypothetical protein
MDLSRAAGIDVGDGKRGGRTGRAGTNWLPDDEGAQLRFAFDAEIKWLEAA